MRNPIAEARESHLAVMLRHRVGATALDLSFELAQPWTILFGPSGAGKTTVLRAIAGLTNPDQASIAFGTSRSITGSTERVVLTDTATRRAVPPHLRRVGFAPQQPSLFPHKTVFQNVSFGVEPSSGARNRPEEIRAAIDPLLDLFRVSGLTHKFPAQLSGGEAQRVNLARAFAAALAPPAHNCRLFLLDEPFTGLEQDLRDQVITDMRTWLGHQRIPVLSVTHDVAEAFQLDAEVIKIAAGRVEAQGPVEIVLGGERRRLLSQLGSAPVEPYSTEPYLAG